MQEESRRDKITNHLGDLTQKQLETARFAAQQRLADEHPEWSARRVEDAAIAQVTNQPETTQPPEDEPPF